MASLVQMEEFRRANERVAELARRDLEAFFGTLDLTRPELARDTLLEFVPVLTAQYGDLAASVAAEWFDELRAAAKVPGRFRAVGAAAVPAAQAEASVRWAASHLFTEAPSGILAPLAGAVVKMVMEPSRNTVIDMSARDTRSVGWHRNARPTACDFCIMLAGRGGVYKSEKSASFAAHDGRCYCTASPSWDANAPEVPTRCYEASERMQKVRNRAADPSDPKKQAKAQRVLDNHRSNVNSWLKDMKPELDDYRAELTQALAA
ncbi:MAG: hypothetical protein L0K65_02605 [Actinomyces sp.]|nr:hypothetical protein [Actinomyces sp.]